MGSSASERDTRVFLRSVSTSDLSASNSDELATHDDTSKAPSFISFCEQHPVDWSVNVTVWYNSFIVEHSTVFPEKLLKIVNMFYFIFIIKQPKKMFTYELRSTNVLSCAI
jgi:hypothetical protein